MKKKYLWISVLILAFATAVFIFVSQNSFSPEKFRRVCFKENCFKLEIAKTDVERNRGLMFRESLPADSGMLFVFDREDIYPFWMKNTLISLDIVWMNSYRQVVYISKNTPSCVTEICPDINPSGNAKYVLEVNGGVADKISLKIGDYLSF